MKFIPDTLAPNRLTRTFKIPNRAQFKHVVYGPQAWSGNHSVTFPAIRDAVEARDWALASKLVDKTAQILQNATAMLQTWEKEAKEKGD